MDNSAVALAAIGLVGTILALVVKPLFGLLREQTRATNALSASMKKVADSNKEIAKETKQGNKEAKARNGHLAELTIESNKQMMEALQNISKQHVDHQVVVKQEVKDDGL